MTGKVQDLVFPGNLLQKFISMLYLLIIQIDKRIIEHQKRLLLRIHRIDQSQSHTATEQILLTGRQPLCLAKFSLFLDLHIDIRIDHPFAALIISQKFIIFAESVLDRSEITCRELLLRCL